MRNYLIKPFIVTTALAVLGGCATAPDVDLGYVLPKASVTVKVDQAITCTESKVIPDTFDVHRENIVSFTASYQDDNSEKFYINPKALGAWYADSEFKVTFQGGRLSTIAPSVTGSGAQVTDFILSIVDMIKSNPTDRSDDVNNGVSTACKIVKDRINGKLKKFNASYEITISDVAASVPAFLPRVAHASINEDDVEALLAIPTLEVSLHARPNVLHRFESTCFTTTKNATTGKDETVIDKDCLIENRQIVAKAPEMYEFKVTVDGEPTSKVIGIPQLGTTYALPLPKPALFGSAAADIAFNADGSVKSITYNASGDFEGQTKSLKAIDEATASESVSELDAVNGQLAVEKAKADLIYQQTRKAICENTPEECKVE